MVDPFKSIPKLFQQPKPKSVAGTAPLTEQKGEAVNEKRKVSLDEVVRKASTLGLDKIPSARGVKEFDLDKDLNLDTDEFDKMLGTLGIGVSPIEKKRFFDTPQEEAVEQAFEGGEVSFQNTQGATETVEISKPQQEDGKDRYDVTVNGQTFQVHIPPATIRRWCWPRCSTITPSSRLTSARR